MTDLIFHNEWDSSTTDGVILKFIDTFFSNKIQEDITRAYIEYREQNETVIDSYDNALKEITDKQLNSWIERLTNNE